MPKRLSIEFKLFMIDRHVVLLNQTFCLRSKLFISDAAVLLFLNQPFQSSLVHHLGFQPLLKLCRSFEKLVVVALFLEKFLLQRSLRTRVVANSFNSQGRSRPDFFFCHISVNVSFHVIVYARQNTGIATVYTEDITPQCTSAEVRLGGGGANLFLK